MKGRIWVTNSFKKQIKDKRLGQALFNEIWKHASGLSNLVDLFSPGKDLKVYKSYLNSKRLRAVILLQVSEKIYTPFMIFKKESREGWNVSKHSKEMLMPMLFKAQQEIIHNQYTEYEF